MSTLKSILAKHTDNLSHLGPAKNIPDSKDEEKKRLVDELLGVRSKNNIFFWICVSLLLILFATSLLLFFWLYKEPALLKTLYGISGISITGLLYYMNKLWKEKTAVDMMIIMASSLNPDTVNSILTVILKKYF